VTARTEPSSDELRAFQATVGFPLDPFQLEACAAIAAGDSVLVAAPTGAGKTIIADFGVYLTIQSTAGKIFYTTPIKALSNQKFHEFQRRYGEDQVGLLTGDTNVNADAPIVVMTTEVLRNMIYEGSDLLGALEFVVLDEVHYLADRFRGPVWEEVIIGLPDQVRLISLSATVSNAEEFGAWLQEVRGHTRVIVSEFRPVPLDQHVLIDNELEDLFGRGHRLSPRLEHLSQVLDVPRRGRGRRGGPRGHADHRSTRVNRARLVRTLAAADLLPMISFIFSRTGCDAAVEQCLAAGVDLTDPSEHAEIDRIIDAHCDGLPEEDRAVLGFDRWRRALRHGLAAHHAGLLPAFKETVEELFQQRLVKAVFATETLALGINMPARTVALERLEKFNGVARVPITPGEYTQLTGRAGRRGIDPRGNAVVVWHPGLDLRMVASLASRRTFPLRSSFRPTYNMAVNLIAQFGAERTRTTLESSFAQYQADRAVVGLSRRLREVRSSLSGYAESAGFADPEVRAYFELREQLHTAETELHRLRRQDPHQDAVAQHRAEIAEIRVALRTHPEHVSAARDEHAHWAQRYFKLSREATGLEAQIGSRTDNIATTFDAVVTVLLDRGYLVRDGDAADSDAGAAAGAGTAPAARASAEPIDPEDAGTVAVTDAGRVLSRIYGERDLLVAECLRRGIWTALRPADLVAVVCALVAEPRREQLLAHAPEPGGVFPRVFDTTVGLWNGLQHDEASLGLPGTAEPSAALAGPMYRWAQGAQLENVLREASMAAGDFVRLVKLVMDMLDQIAQTSVPEVSDRARTGIDLIRRGIVAYSIEAGAA
jgi:ATP-dependent RNA helicase HelY